MSTELRNFLALPYDELEDLNLRAKEQRKNRVPMDKIQEERLKYLTDEKRIKAVTVLFSDLEGRLHMLDYDKKFLLKSWDNLTFDGSSIRGFTAQRESDLRLGIDWSAFYWAPADVFGPGKVLVFGEVIDKDGSPYAADIRGVLKDYRRRALQEARLHAERGQRNRRLPVQGPDAERRYHETGKFEYVNTGGYYHSLPGDPLRTFIDTTAEVQRAMGFQNEKDHPEVAPSQFEINYSYAEVVAAADQIQLYKLICRQVATKHGLDRVVPAQAGRRRQWQRHAHQRFRSARAARTCSGTPRAKRSSASWAGQFIDRILTHGNDICLLLNASVNAYRRLDPHFEAPNQIKASAVGSRLDDPHSHRQRAQHARGSALGGAGRESLHGDVLDLQDRPRRRDREDQEPAPGGALPARQHLRRARELPQGRVDDEAARRRREGTLCRPEAGLGRPLPAPAGDVREGARSAVSPRRLQPVFVEPVLESGSAVCEAHFSPECAF